MRRRRVTHHGVGGGGRPVREADGSQWRLRHLLALGITLVGLVLAVLAGLWGLQADRSDGDPGHDRADPTASGWHRVQGGWLRVDKVIDGSVSHGSMPGMQSMPEADPVPPDHVRYLVRLALAAESGDLRWRSRDFILTGAAMPATAPRELNLGGRVVPDRSSVTGTVTFDVPEAAEDLELHFAQGPGIPLEVSRASSARSPGDGHTTDTGPDH